MMLRLTTRPGIMRTAVAPADNACLSLCVGRPIPKIILQAASHFTMDNSKNYVNTTFEQLTALVWKGMRDKGRNCIRLARDFLRLDYDLNANDFISFYNVNLDRLGLKNSIDMGLVSRLLGAALSKNRGALFGARDKAGKLASVIFCVWDDSSYYYLMSIRTDTAHRGATSLVLWEAISEAMRRGLIFVFDGIISDGSARLAANFAPTVAPRYIATRESKAMRRSRPLQPARPTPQYFIPLG